jgi:DNA-binding CsgD family transcriptional regulator
VSRRHTLRAAHSARGRGTFPHPKKERYTCLAYTIPVDLATQVLDLVGQIYDSVERPELWPATVQAIADSVGSSMTGFSVIDTSGHADSVGVYLGIDEAARRQYEAYYSKLNLHALHALESMPMVPGAVVNSREWGIDAKLLRSEYYNDFLRPLNSFHTAGVVITREDSCMAVFSCFRPLSRDQFGDESTALLKLLLPHLQRAVRLNQRLGLLRSTTEDFEDLATGAILFDRSSRVLRVNRRAREIIDQDDGITLRRSGLELAARGQNELLKKLIADCCATSSGHGSRAGGVLALQRMSGKLAYHLLISPIRFSPLVTGSREPAAILFISDPEQAPQIPWRTLAQLHGLTAAEARLSNLLLKGDDLTDACALLRITRNTGRAHLRSIFDKLDVKSQSQLVAVLARSLIAGWSQRINGRSGF